MFARLKTYYHKLVHSHASTEEVAQGMALGVFIAFTPTAGLHVFLAIFLAAVLKKNEISTFIGVWVNNPLTLLPLYYCTYKVGAWLLGQDAGQFNPSSLRDFFNMGGQVLMPLWTGGLVLGLIAAVSSYYLTKRLYPYMKKKKTQIMAKVKHDDHAQR